MAATQSEKTPQELPGPSGKTGSAERPGGHWPPDRPARLSGRIRLPWLEGSPRSERQEEAGKAETREQPLGANRSPDSPRQSLGQERVEVPEPEEEASEARTRVPTPGAPFAKESLCWLL